MVMMIVVVTAVVVMTVVWIWGRNWSATVKSDVAVCPIDVDVRSWPTFFLYRLLYCRSRGAMFM